MGVLKKVGQKIKNGINNAAKTLAQSGNSAVAGLGSLVDALVPDEKKEAMAEAAQRDGVTKVAEVEQTIQREAANKGISDVAVINEAVHVTARAIAEETKTTINDNAASVKLTAKEKIIAFTKKYWKWIVGGVAALSACIVAVVIRKRRKGGKKYRR